MTTVTLQDGAASFEVTVLEAARPARLVLFAAGRGGGPQRHHALLASLSARDCTVIAPHFEMIAPRPTGEDLVLRARRLAHALTAVPDLELPVAGVGHSIGATLLLALAGAQVWMGPGKPLDLPRCPRLDRLVLLAPAIDFVRAPGALAAVQIPMRAWAGTQDAYAPPAHVECLTSAPGVVELRVIEGAGHFSFMDAPPPQTVEPLVDRERFLAELAVEVGEFLTAS